MTTPYVWIVADYKQAEAMIVAWAGPVPRLVEWFRNGEDIHLNVAKLIAKTVQEQKLKLPTTLFVGKPWQELTADDMERYIAKRTVHANNYGMGSSRFALITKLPEKIAQLIQIIYFRLFPEIKTGYQTWIESQIKSGRTLRTPMGRVKVFYDAPGPELYRSAYSGYAQMTVGDMKTQWLCDVCEAFSTVGELEYVTPHTIRACGLDVGLEMHDSLAVRVPNDDIVIEHAGRLLLRRGDIPLTIKDQVLHIPVDLKIGPNLKDLTPLKVAL